MLLLRFAFDRRFASGGDGVRIVETEGHSVHHCLCERIDSAALVELEGQRFCIGGFEDHSGAIPHHAVVRERELAPCRKTS